MTTRRWLILAGVLALAALAGIVFLIARPGDDGDDVWEQVEETGVLRVGMDASYPPFESVNEQNEIVGFDVDLANAIGRELGLEMVFVNMAYDTADWSAVRDSMIVCSFCEGVFGFMLGQDHVDAINHTVGWDVTLDELAEIGCRIHTLERSFNCREGLRRKDDTVPRRFMHEKIPGGPSNGMRLKPEELQQMLDAYYERRGWDEKGVPTAETLERLGLEDLVSVF